MRLRIMDALGLTPYVARLVAWMTPYVERFADWLNRKLGKAT